MPKYGIHHVVLADAIDQKLLVDSRDSGRRAGEILSENHGVAMLGAVGPDLFFFAPDFDVVEGLLALYENIEGFVDLYEQAMAPIRKINETVIEPVEQTVESLGGETVELIQSSLAEVRETAELFKAAVNSSLLTGVIEGVNAVTDLAFPKATTLFFDKVFKPPLQNGEPITNWYWFDMLHYRRTGDFARQLRNLATTDQQRAYAFGYLSHIATDVVGHPYVNQIVGGPYRLAMQRHVTVENYMDCWKFQQSFGRGVNGALLGKLRLPQALPDDVSALLDQAFRATYTDESQHPRRANMPADGFFTGQQLHDTFAVFRRVLVTMEKMAVPRPAEPFSGVADILSRALQDFMQPPPEPPKMKKKCSWGEVLSFGLSEQSRSCYKTFFEEAAAWIEYAGQLLAYSFETLLDLVDLLLAVLLSLPVKVLLAILYGIQLTCYQIYLTTHGILAQHGLVFPEPADLGTSYGVNLTTPVLACPVSGYPRPTDLEVGHLVCPTGGVEVVATTADFYPADPQTTPDAFISQRPLNLANLKLYAEAESPAVTRQLGANGTAIGNATELTAWMIATAADPRASGVEQQMAFANWNLDSDRGYGYKSWFGDFARADGAVEVRDERYVDLPKPSPPAPLKIDRVTPAGIFIGSGEERSEEFRVFGDGFLPGAAVSFSGSAISAKGTKFSAKTELTVDATVRHVPAETPDVTVTNPDGSQAVLANAVGVNIKG